MSSEWFLSLRFPHQNRVATSSPSALTRATWPAHLILLDVITRMILVEQDRAGSNVVGIGTVRGSDPGGGDVFYTWGPSSLLYNRYRIFPVVKAAGARR